MWDGGVVLTRTPGSPVLLAIVYSMIIDIHPIRDYSTLKRLLPGLLSNFSPPITCETPMSIEEELKAEAECNKFDSNFESLRPSI
jgi:hypothetical protein